MDRLPYIYRPATMTWSILTAQRSHLIDPRPHYGHWSKHFILTITTNTDLQ